MWLRAKGYSIAVLACVIMMSSIMFGSYIVYNHFSGPNLEYNANCTIKPDVISITCHGLFGIFDKKFLVAQMQFEAQTFRLCSFYELHCDFQDSCALEEYNSALQAFMLFNQSQCWIDRSLSKMYLTDYYITDRKNYKFAIEMIGILIGLFISILLSCFSKCIFERDNLQTHNVKDNSIFGEYALQPETS